MKQDQVVAEVQALIQARNTLIWIVSREELRVERSLIGIAEKLNMQPLFWDCADGITAGDNTAVDAEKADPLSALQTIASERKRSLYVMRDLHKWLDPMVLRSLRSLSRKLQGAPRNAARAVVILSPSSEVPPELADSAKLVEWPLPDREEMGAILDNIVESLEDDLRADALPPDGARDAAIDAAVGLTAEEAASSYARSLVTARNIDPALVAAEKQRVVSGKPGVDWFDPDPRGLDAIGGLDILKSWLIGRKAAFGPKAREYGLPAPKGVLLLGPPGTGKSLTAKAVATAWGQPLLRLDMGGLKSKFVGDSEQNIRGALQVAETVAPCVLWVDEIEKALSGSTGAQGDGGVSADALGTLLSWMQDRAGSVFVVATANDVTALPPELLRKGRFDELFFVDLPNATERGEIITASLRQYGRDDGAGFVDKKAHAAIIEETDGFTGAEIAALIPDALYAAFADDERPLDAADVLAAAKCVVPLSTTAKDKVEGLRNWAKGRCRFASTSDEVAATSTKRGIEL